MKRKSPRGIPDFSSKKPSKLPSPVDKALHEKAVRPGFEQPKIKPQATSQKSGRRGS